MRARKETPIENVRVIGIYAHVDASMTTMDDPIVGRKP